MLIVFYGPSCVGRTTLMRILARDYRWRFVPVLTTRALRSGESEKCVVTEDELRALAKAEELLMVSRSFGNAYSWRKTDLQEASASPGFWMLDFKISLSGMLRSFSPREVVVLPPNEDILRQRILQAGRAERLDAILADYREHYYELENVGLNGRFLIINWEGETGETANRIHKEVSSAPPRGDLLDNSYASPLPTV